jgi:hypothetical protein
MKKHGPPPWGRKIAGWRLVVIGSSSWHSGPKLQTESNRSNNYLMDAPGLPSIHRSPIRQLFQLTAIWPLAQAGQVILALTADVPLLASDVPMSQAAGLLQALYCAVACFFPNCLSLASVAAA